MSNAYCVRADVENRYGATNVAAWADVDASGLSATITARITWAIGFVGDDIDSIVSKQHYLIPLQDQNGTTPTLIREVAATLVGVVLYESHGIEDVDREGRPLHRLSALREWAYGVLEQIRKGEREIPGAV